MFTKPTVFVLGAGISAPFGFPVGRQMKDAICNGHYTTSRGTQRGTFHLEQMADLIAEALGSPSATMHTAKRFMDAFRASDMYSIDTWLEVNQADAGLLQAGKYAIAATIINAEAEAARQGADVNEDWFIWLWNNLWTSDINDLGKNQVYFVTFNYDRLFEWKLDRQIKNTYLRVSSQQHENAFKEITSRIVHAHGALKPPKSTDILYGFGDFGFRNLVSGSDSEKESVRKKYIACMQSYSQSINIVCEQPQDSLLIDRAKAIIQQKDARLIFLGFSYDKRNILKLGLNEYAKTFGLPDSRDPNRRIDQSRIIGTAMGIKRSERDMIRTMLSGRISLDEHNMDAVEFCRSHLRVG